MVQVVASVLAVLVLFLSNACFAGLRLPEMALILNHYKRFPRCGEHEKTETI